MRAGFYAPATVFALLGVLDLSLAHVTFFQLRGGLSTYGAYVLALQVVLTMFLVAAIDDARDSAFADWHGLRDFYASRPVPALLLAFGVAASMTTIAVGVLGRNTMMLPLRPGVATMWSELALGVVFVLTVLVQVGAEGRGAAGWCVGFAGGCVAGQIQLAANVNMPLTVLGWSLFAVMVYGLVVLVRIVIVRRKRAPVAA
jgi:hypothetical protein